MNTIKFFIGRGEVKGFEFCHVEQSEFGLLYEVKDGNRIYYEVFRKKSSPPTHESYQYPTSKAFGIWAWTYKTLGEAKQRMALSYTTKERSWLKRWSQRVNRGELMHL
jgi:hypothetical protein